MHLSNGQPIPFDSIRQGLKASIDSWLSSQTASTPATAQTHAIFMWDPPPHFNLCNTSTSCIEEVMESHILQVKGKITSDKDKAEFSHDIFEVFTTEKKKHRAKAPELSTLPPAAQATTPLPPSQMHTTGSSNSCPNSQYRYHSNAKDQQQVSELEEYLMQGRLSLMTPAHVFAASSVICKNIVEKLKVQRVETNKYEAVSARLPQALATLLPAAHHTTIHDNTFNDIPHAPDALSWPSAFCLPLQEIDILVNATIKVLVILDTSSQIVIIWHNIVQSLGVPINYQRLIEMEGANGATNWTVGCTEGLTLQVGDVSFKVHTHVVEHTSFSLLLGQPF